MPAKKLKKTAKVDDEAELDLDDEVDSLDDLEEGFGDDTESDEADKDESY